MAHLSGQLMMMHLDIAVEDLEKGVAWALELGATLAEHQPQPHVRVMLDPDGHLFCLFQGGPRGEFDPADWHGGGGMTMPTRLWRASCIGADEVFAGRG